VIPLTEKPDPLQAAEDTVTSAFVADNVPVNDELLPMATFPKLSAEGESVSVPEFCPDDCVPFPVYDCVSDASAALLTKEMLPEEVPDVRGANTIV
jgi:hypothetical protein